MLCAHFTRSSSTDLLEGFLRLTQKRNSSVPGCSSSAQHVMLFQANRQADSLGSSALHAFNLFLLA